MISRRLLKEGRRIQTEISQLVVQYGSRGLLGCNAV